MQGFNMGRYVPPEHEGLTSGNKLAGKHALGSRGRKAGQGVLTVRFEMPFAIWCTSCPAETIIGQGVRFNAEKKKVGNYYSSPIYSFRMKHTACGGWIEIRTDPKNTAYVVTEGARKRETGEDEVRDGDMVIRSEEEKERLRNDAFAALEVTIEGRQQDKANGDRINELLGATDKNWDDPYAANKRLRNSFRVGRKQREKDNAVAEEIKDRFGLGLDLLPENEEDVRRAAYAEFGRLDDTPDTAIRRARGKEIFAEKSPTQGIAESGKLKSDMKQAATKQKLRRELGQNTRAINDPFLTTKPSFVTMLPGIKRKRSVQSTKTITEDMVESSRADRTRVSDFVLVDYDSD